MQIGSLSTAFMALFFVASSSGCFRKDVPREQKLADCTTNAFAFRVAWPTGELFQIVLGVPYADTNALAFNGELVFRQSTGTVARILVDSHHVTPCNWLDNQASDPKVAGYILTWGRTNIEERLDRLFVDGQIYDVEVRFNESPPVSSTLWLSWIGNTGG